MTFEGEYNYPFGKYAVIKEFNKVDTELLEEIKKVIKKHFEIENDLVRHKKEVSNSDLQNINKSISRVGDIFKNYPWVKDSHDFLDGKGYLINQYKLAAIAEVFVKKMSLIEAAFEAAYLMRDSLGMSGLYIRGSMQRISHSHFWKKKDRVQFKKIIENRPIIIFLVVKYLKQLGYDKNLLKDKELCESLEKSLNNLKEEIEKKKLSKEEWDERWEHKIKVQY